LGALGITLVISILSGALCGYLASHVGMSGDKAFNLFTDDGHWEHEEKINYNLGEVVKQVETTIAQAENKVVEMVEVKSESEDEEAQEAQRKKDAKKAAKKEKRKKKAEAEAGDGDSKV